MGRGKDKTINAKDIANMSPRDRAGLANLAKMRRVKITGTAVVTKKDGNVRYGNPARPGSYNEEKL